MHSHRAGSGKPLLLVHGLGSSWRCWRPVMNPLIAEREVVAVDLPGHGASPAQADSGTFAGLARSLEAFLLAEGLEQVDMVGSSLGARLVLEMARRGSAGAVVSLDPDGFWQGWERDYVRTTLGASVAILRLMRPSLPALAHNFVARSALLAQLSARPWALSGDLIATELASLADTATVDALIRDLADGPRQEGPAAPGTGRIAIGWGRQDRLLRPVQAEHALAAFPSASLHWFESCGHFPMWDRPKETVRMILETIN